MKLKFRRTKLDQLRYTRTGLPSFQIALLVFLAFAALRAVYPKITITSNTAYSFVFAGEHLADVHQGQAQTLESTPSRTRNTPPNTGISVWFPDTQASDSPTCSGTFVSTDTAEETNDAFPLAMVRDAMTDWRVVTAKYARVQIESPPEPVLNLVMYVSAHLSVKLRLNGSDVALFRPDGSPLQNIHSKIVRIHANNGHHMPDKDRYYPGRLSSYGQEILEWEVLIAVWPSPEAGLSGKDPQAVMSMLRAVSSGSPASDPKSSAPTSEPVFKFKIPLLHYAGKEGLEFTPTVSANCFVDWELGPRRPSIEPFSVRRYECPEPNKAKDQSGSILLCGSPLHGNNRNVSSGGVARVAHQAARNLLGPLRFDAVMVPVVNKYSMTEIDVACRGEAEHTSEESCRRRMLDENEQDLDTIAREIERELGLIGVEESLWQHVIVAPLCRLGSHSQAKSKNGSAVHPEIGCDRSFWHGQHIQSRAGYALAGSRFAWAAFADVDEYFGPVHEAWTVDDVRKPLQPRKIYDLLEELKAESRLSSIKFQYMNFLVHNESMNMALTRQSLTQAAPYAVQGSGEGRSCYVPVHKNGKSIVRCDRALGFDVHEAWMITRSRMLPGRELIDRIATGWRLTAKGYRTIHGRLSEADGDCELVP